MSVDSRQTDATARDRWARALGVTADAGPADARAAFLRLLPGEGFNPPEARVSALNGLTASNVNLTPAGLDDEREQVKGDVDAFAAAFWSLAPAERRKRWLELTARGRGTSAEGRLHALEIGLSVDAAGPADPGMGEVALIIRELFVLPTRARAVRRTEWLAERASRKVQLVDAGVRLRARNPEVARLGTEFLHGLLWEPSWPVAIEGVEPHTEDRDGFAATAGGRAKKHGTSGYRRPDEKYKNPFFVAMCALLAIVGVTVKLASYNAQSITNFDHLAKPSMNRFGTVPMPASTYYPPDPPAIFSPLTKLFTHEEIEEFKKYEREPSGKAPLNYYSWVMQSSLLDTKKYHLSTRR